MLKVRKSNLKRANASFLAVLLISSGISCGAAYAKKDADGAAPATPPSDTFKNFKIQTENSIPPALLKDWQQSKPPETMAAPKLAPGEQTTLDPQGREIK